MPYNLILVPLIALIIAQLIKVIIDSLRGEFSWSNFNSYGGMPSSHATMVSALTTEIASQTGLASPYFAISLVLALLIIRDAVGLRQALSKHGRILNMMIKDLPDYEESKYPHLEERLGHTYPQVLVGILIGIAVALLF